MSQLHDGNLQTIYLPNGGDPENVNLPSLQMPGMLGGRVVVPTTAGNKKYQLVQVDSSPTNTPVNPFDGATAWWSDRDKYKVGTAPAALGRGNVAGVFVNAPTPGYYTCIQQKGKHDQVKGIDSLTAAPGAAGQFVIPSATNAKADVLAAGTASSYPSMGYTAGTLNLSDNTFAVNLDVPELP